MPGGAASPARCQGRSWWWNTTAPSWCSRARSAVRVAASGLIGSEQRFSTTTRSAPASVARQRRRDRACSPRRGRWRGRGARCRRAGGRRRARPATRRTRKPSSWSAHSHLRASTATPSAPPRRYEIWTATGSHDGRLAQIAGDRRAQRAARPRSIRAMRRLSRRAARARSRRRGRGARSPSPTRPARAVARRRPR